MTTAVIIATYNGEKYVKEQLESILNQTRKVDKIYIFDDCSKDNTFEICNELAKNSNGVIEIHKNEKNLGYRKNFETALLSAKKYDVIFFSDQDDWWFPSKVETTVAAFEKSDKLALFFSNAYIADEGLEIADDKNLFNINFPIKLQKIFKKNPLSVLCYGGTISGCTMAIRNILINQVTPFSQNWVHDAWIGANACLLGEIQYTTEKLIKYRKNPNQEIGTDKKIIHNRGLDKIKYAISSEASQKEILFLNSKLEKLYEFKNFIEAKDFLNTENLIALTKTINFLEGLKKNYRKNFISKFFFFVRNSINGNYYRFGMPFSHRIRDIFLYDKSSQ